MRGPLFLVLFAFILGGCAHLGGGDSVSEIPDGAPSVDTLMKDVAATSAAMHSLEGTALVRFELPGVEGVQKFPTGRIHFRAPDQFFAYGRKFDFRIQMFVEGDRFLLDVDSENAFYIGQEGDRFDELVLQVSPSALFRELFLLAPFGGATAEEARLSTYDGSAQRATVEVFASKRRKQLTRRVTLKEDGVWQIESVTVFNEQGHEIATTECGAYATIDDVVVPAAAKVRFPEHKAEMEYVLSKSKSHVNQPAAFPISPIDEVRASLLAKGHKEIRGIPEDTKAR